MIYARLFRPTKSALRDFSHEQPPCLRASFEQRISYPLSDRSFARRDETSVHSRSSVSFLFFFSFSFSFTPQTLSCPVTRPCFAMEQHEEGRMERRKRYRRMLLVKVKGRRGISDVENTLRRQLHRKITSVRTHSPSLKSEGRERLRLFLRESPCDAPRREKLPSVPGLKLSSRYQRRSVLLSNTAVDRQRVRARESQLARCMFARKPSFGVAACKTPSPLPRPGHPCLYFRI